MSPRVVPANAGIRTLRLVALGAAITTADLIGFIGTERCDALFCGNKPRLCATASMSQGVSGVIDKQVKTTADAVAGVKDGSTVLVAGFGMVGVADQSARCLARAGRKGIDHRRQQFRQWRPWAGAADQCRPRPQGDLLLPPLRRLQRVSQCLPGQKPRTGTGPAGHHQRAHALRGGRARRLLLAGVGAHKTRRRQGDPRDRWPAPCV